jgi:hypothetical protein
MLDDLQQHEEDSEMTEVKVKIESLAVSHGMLGRLVGEHAQDIRSSQKVIVALGNTVIKQQVEIVNLGNTVIKQQEEIVKHQVDINQLSSFVGVLMAERADTRRLMVFRQLATAYQFRAATVLNHPNRPDLRFMVTHEVLRMAKTSNINVLQALESRFVNRDSQLTGAGIEKKIKMIRGSGVSTSHPTKLMASDGSEYSPSAQDLEDLINDLCDRQVVMPALRSCALALLDNIVLTASDPTVQSLVGTDLLKSSP